MKLEAQVCTLEQAIKLNELGVSQKSIFYYQKWDICEDDGPFSIISSECLDKCNENPMVSPLAYSAYTASELLKMLPFIIRHEGNDYFLGFGHSSKGYRVIYETNKLGLIFNIDDELDREKKALFGTMRSDKFATNVLAEYLRMLIEHGDGVVFLDEINNRLNA